MVQFLFYIACKTDALASINVVVLEQKFQQQLKNATWIVKPREEVKDEEIAGPGLFWNGIPKNCFLVSP